ncbi:MAG: lytic murein transglycosylase [Desulfuromonas sp.]|nr:lytic murein transglycosylase [Desulfuromonas sp.]
MKPVSNRLLAFITLCWLFSTSTVAQGSTNDFELWLKAFRVEARAAGISPATLHTALARVNQLQPKVISLDRKQPERLQSLKQYIETRICKTRIAIGRKMMDRYPTWLGRVERKYGVQKRFIVALWGIETNYGTYTGGFPVIQSLMTLAYDSRRSTYFRRELLNALHIIDAGHVGVSRMKGSWAGAMGQCQFMPSSFLHYAADGNGDNQIDIWGTIPDVLASTANYLRTVGWKDDQTWGRPVTVPETLDSSLLGLGTRLPLSRWQALGVRRSNGSTLPRRELEASLLMPDGRSGPGYLVYDNFRALLAWNRSNAFAIAVGTLSDRIAEEQK